LSDNFDTYLEKETLDKISAMKKIGAFFIVIGICSTLFLLRSKGYECPVAELKAKNLWTDTRRLHLGCGQNRLEGYINIDFPQSEHNVMNVQPDLSADILKLDFPQGTIDEIRLHHVFEHFTRIRALSLLIRWHGWLKDGGILHIETPDIAGCAKTLASEAPYEVKMRVIRHLSGDQCDSWAFHIDHWFAERFQRTLERFGFEIVSTTPSEYKNLSNISVIARKTVSLPRDKLIAAAEELLQESLVSKKHEKKALLVWKRQLQAALKSPASDSKGNRTVN